MEVFMITTKDTTFGGLVIRAYIDIRKNQEPVLLNVEAFDAETGLKVEIDTFLPKVQIIIYDIGESLFNELQVGA